MNITQKNLIIELESESEIEVFWNIIAFALDLQAERDKENKPCMTEDEKQMAHKLYDLTERKH